MTDSHFDLDLFLPYLLNQAAEAVSREFQAIYRERHGMTRTQWRVMANLGRFGAMTARDICAASHEEKTRVSRAVAALEVAGFLARLPSDRDGRAEILSLTAKGLAVFADLGQQALSYDAGLRAQLGAADADALHDLLLRLRALVPPAAAED
ncbi:MarR family winged helix-turn-helix transcriptional regulator [Frigidibacter sp. SD6-1]|uniref:MarR family winged helix-turn-helix transcriptional regulator n=1 Tax=Frigidibacter sp. SD6-1 TaxID=3032581 RepID=UPI0024DF4397|nr:MarR family winged helix-turn-helix transcriptional regulator [Frigidibacter sp. SD6-1]